MIKKRLNDKHTLIKNILFPSTFTTTKGKNRALLGIGGNIGRVAQRFNRLYIYLSKSPLLNIIELSPILKNPPFGYTNQDDFYNALILIETNLTPHQLLRYVLKVEQIFGRKRLFENAPRTLDIDIVFYKDKTINTKDLTLPHKDWHNRDSVVTPLSFMKESV